MNGTVRRSLALIAAFAAASLLTLLPAGCANSRTASRFPPGANTPESARRGGHAVFVREGDQDYMDPALSYETYSSPVIEAVFRTLLNYASVPGSAGARLVPELADALPELRENGTLYCFGVSKDARFGAPLHRHITAADFKYSLERLFRVGSPGLNFYRSIVGASDVLAGRTTQLAGVIARGDSLYVRILHPDPVFLYLMSMSFAAPLPREIVERYSGTLSQHAVSSGPYAVAEFTPRRRVLLVRNPDYRGTPGSLDTIEVRFGVQTLNAVAMIRRGLADGGFFEVPGPEVMRLRRDPVWRSQVDIADGLGTTYLFFNVRMKPFSDVRVRQAVAWALDRRADVKVWSGRAAIAGEVLPPGMPGARALNCYAGPDMQRARRLMREAGYPNGFSTMFYGATEEPWPREMTVIQQELAEIGIHATIDLREISSYFPMVNDTSRHIPFGMGGWVADYVDPSNFFDTLLNGRRITGIHNNNLSLFDDPSVNDAIERAMVTPDDSARARMWVSVDRAVMERAPIVPLVHALESRLYHPRLGGWYRHVTRILKLEDVYLKTQAPSDRTAAHVEVHS